MSELEYNSTRPLMLLPEYGRNVQKMVDYCLSVEDKEEQNKVANAIIKVMGQLNPHLRDIEDYNHKLWDHLYIMCDFKLDLDGPYDKPEPETFKEKPEKVNYPKGRIKYGHYGKTIEELIEKATEIKDEDERKYLVNMIVNLMKRFYLTWNRDSVKDEVILENLKELSGGKIDVKLEDVKITATSEIVSANKRTKRKNGKGGNKGGRQRRKR